MSLDVAKKPHTRWPQPWHVVVAHCKRAIAKSHAWSTDTGYTPSIILMQSSIKYSVVSCNMHPKFHSNRQTHVVTSHESSISVAVMDGWRTNRWVTTQGKVKPPPQLSFNRAAKLGNPISTRMCVCMCVSSVLLDQIKMIPHPKVPSLKMLLCSASLPIASRPTLHPATNTVSS